MARSRMAKYSAIMALIVFAFFFADNFALYQLSPVQREVMQMFNLSPSQYSFVYTAPLLAGASTGLIAGLLCDRFGVRKVITIALTIATAAIVLRIFVSSFLPLFICMFFSGLACGMMSANLSKYLGPWFPEDKLSIWLGFVTAGATLSSVVAMIIVPYFPSVKSTFIFGGILAVLAFVLWIIFVRDPQDFAETTEEKARLGDPDAVTSGSEVWKGIKSAFKNSNIWFVGLALFFVMGATIIVSGFLPTALQEVRGLAPEEAGMVTAIILAGTLLGTLVGPAISAKIGKEKAFLATCALIAGVGTAFAWLAPEGPVLIGVLLITGFALSADIPILMSMPIKLVGPNRAGTAGGVAATLQALGAVVIPNVITPLTSSGDLINFNLMFILAGIGLIVTIICTLLLPDFSKRSGKLEA